MDKYTARQKQGLLAQVARGANSPRCPRCRAACSVIRVEPRSDVAYVRDRIVVRCSGCLRNCSIEARELDG